jgi:hypothetical protein
MESPTLAVVSALSLQHFCMSKAPRSKLPFSPAFLIQGSFVPSQWNENIDIEHFLLPLSKILFLLYISDIIQRIGEEK